MTKVIIIQEVYLAIEIIILVLQLPIAIISYLDLII
jgi:hypothetical protein